MGFRVPGMVVKGRFSRGFWVFSLWVANSLVRNRLGAALGFIVAWFYFMARK